MLLLQAEHVKYNSRHLCDYSVLSNNHDDDYIGFKLRARYTLPRLGGYKKMCHQRGGLRPHQQEKTPTTSTQLHHSLDLELNRAPPASCVCTHEYLLRIPGRWCGSMAVPYSQSRTRCGPWPYHFRILKNIEPYVSSHERTGMYARAEFFRPGKVRRCIRKSTEARSFQIANPYGNYILRHSTAPLHQPDLIPVPDAYQTGPVAE